MELLDVFVVIKKTKTWIEYGSRLNFCSYLCANEYLLWRKRLIEYDIREVEKFEKILKG